MIPLRSHLDFGAPPKHAPTYSPPKHTPEQHPAAARPALKAVPVAKVAAVQKAPERSAPAKVDTVTISHQAQQLHAAVAKPVEAERAAAKPVEASHAVATKPAPAAHATESKPAPAAHVTTSKSSPTSHKQEAVQTAANAAVGDALGTSHVIISNSNQYLGKYRNANLPDDGQKLHNKLENHLGKDDMKKLMDVKDEHYRNWLPTADAHTKEVVQKAATYIDDHVKINKHTVIQKIVNQAHADEHITGNGDYRRSVKGFLGIASHSKDTNTRAELAKKYGLTGKVLEETYGKDGTKIAGVIRGKIAPRDLAKLEPARAEGIKGRVAGRLTTEDPFGGTSIVKNGEKRKVAVELYAEKAADIKKGDEFHKVTQDAKGNEKLKLALRYDGNDWKSVKQLPSNIEKVLDSPVTTKIGKVAGKLGAVGAVVDLAVSFHEDGNKVGKHTVEAAASTAGAWAGAEAGAEAGAVIGSFVGPVGTVVGGVVGGIVGGVAGSAAGKYIADHAHQAYKAASHAIQKEAHHVAAEAGKVAHEASAEAHKVAHKVATEAHKAVHEVKSAVHQVEHKVATVAHHVEHEVAAEFHHVEHKVASVAHHVEHKVATEAHEIGHAVNTEVHKIAHEVSSEAHKIGHAVSSEAHKVAHEASKAVHSVESFFGSLFG